MSIEEVSAAALFKFITPNGSCWAFLISDDKWVITRDGTQVACGLTDRASLDVGVRQFMSHRTQLVGRSGVASRPGRPGDQEQEAAA
jgi:hypothetical protein